MRAVGEGRGKKGGGVIRVGCLRDSFSLTPQQKTSNVETRGNHES